MIDGEFGPAIVESIVVLRAADVENSDTISTTLLGAVFAQALRAGCSPVSVLLDLCSAVPNDEDWEPTVRERVEQAIELMEARGL